MKSRGEAVSWREVRGLCRGFWSPCEVQAACWRGGFIWRPQTHTLAGWVFIFSDRTFSYFCTSPDHSKRTTKMSRWLKCTSMYFVGIKILQWYFSLKLCCSFSSFFLCMQKLEGERLIFNWVCVCFKLLPCGRMTYSFLHKFKEFRNPAGFSWRVNCCLRSLELTHLLKSLCELVWPCQT